MILQKYSADSDIDRTTYIYYEKKKAAVISMNKNGIGSEIQLYVKIGKFISHKHSSEA